MTKYEALAQDIEALVASGTLVPGDRLPSVREMADSRGISRATVFQAYYLLEARGIIEARSRSGYFVNGVPRPREQPPLSQPPKETAVVEVNRMVMDVLQSMRMHEVVPIASAFPNPDLFPLGQLARGCGPALRKLSAREHLESLAPGNPALRREIGRRYLATGTRVSHEEVVVTNGAMEALKLCLEATTRPGDLVAVEAPTFYGCLQMLELLQRKAVRIPTSPSDGIQVEALRDLLSRQPIKACWLMTNFQNPTGASMPTESKKALVQLLAEHEVPLIEDDVYSELFYGATRPPPAKAFDERGLVLHCGSFSKSLAPSYRVGWTAAGRFAREVEFLKMSSTVGVAVPSQLAVLEFLQHGGYENHLRTLRKALAARCELTLRCLDAFMPEGSRFTRPQGGYFTWVELPGGVDALDLHRMALERQVCIAPGRIFSPDQQFKQFVRINYGHPEPDAMPDALRTLGELATTLAARAAQP